MSKIIAIANQKGGVGKTTTTQILGLGFLNKKALLIDLDPQANLTSVSDIPETEELNRNIYDLFKGEANLDEAIIETSLGYDIISGTLEMASADMEFSTINREFILKNIIKKINDNYDYDYILIDTPPALGILSINALVAADEVIIPLTATKLALEGFKQLYKTIIAVSNFHNENIKIKGLLINMYKNTKINKKYLSLIEEVAAKENINIFRQKIRVATVIERKQDEKENLFLLKNENIVKDYEGFIDELI